MPIHRLNRESFARRSITRLLPALLIFMLATILAPSPIAKAATLPTGFQESIAFSGLTNPTAVRFASDGRVFVAEKSGLIKVFSSITATTPTIFADLRTNVYNFWDRGLLGMALDPSFPTKPYVYVLYTYDHQLGASTSAPLWGPGDGSSDPCPTPPGPTTDGCIASGRLSRLQANGNVVTGTEQVLVEGWCQQFPSHSVGSLAFGADGKLYASGGDGASFGYVDYGQAGNPLNPCGDPPVGVGGVQTPPTAEGGALRSQSLRRNAGEPALLNGTVIRVDPDTGNGLSDNPLGSSSDPNARRIIGYGLRNPFRITVRPGTNDVWIGDVGWGDWEEINRISNPTGASPVNFGWPCYEGNAPQVGYDNLNVDICENLYATPSAVTPPVLAYNHTAKIVPGEACPTGSSSVSGVTFQFYNGGPYPANYDGALFFADYSRNCIWVMPKGANGLPNPAAMANFVTAAASPVDIQISPGGELFYADFDGGTIRRIQYFSGNVPPIAVATANPTNGIAPLTVNFDGTGSSDSDSSGPLTYNWDLNGDGLYDDSTSATPTYTYTQAGAYTARLRVIDSGGASGYSSPITITIGQNTPPTATINTPLPSTTWRAGDVISFSGSATDSQEGTLPPSALSWEVILHHCPSNCHTHLVQTFSGIANGAISAPDHEYPSYLELRLTATDSGGMQDTKSITLDPQTVDLSFQSNPTGLQLGVGSSNGIAPFSRTVIIGSTNSISAPAPQNLGGRAYAFSSWSDGGAQSHNIVAPNTSATYSAVYTDSGPANTPTNTPTRTPTPTNTPLPTNAPTNTPTSTPTPPLSNLALNKPATADSACGSSEGPEKAVNGSVSGGNSDKWCSLGTAPFLQVDLGASYSLSQFIVKHAGAGGESTSWNTRDFTIQVSADASTWVTVVTVSGNTASQTSHPIAATSARYVRLNVQTPTSDGNNATRIYEFEVYNS